MVWKSWYCQISWISKILTFCQTEWSIYGSQSGSCFHLFLINYTTPPQLAIGTGGETRKNIQMSTATITMPKALVRPRISHGCASAMVMRPRSRGAPGSCDEVKFMRSETSDLSLELKSTWVGHTCFVCVVRISLEVELDRSPGFEDYWSFATQCT